MSFSTAMSGMPMIKILAMALLVLPQWILEEENHQLNLCKNQLLTKYYSKACGWVETVVNFSFWDKYIMCS